MRVTYRCMCQYGEGSVFESSYINVNNCTSSWDSSIIIESIKSKSIAYDGTRIKWCKDYALLKVFIKSAFCMQGKWWSFGGRSKKLDASNADFSIIWYPGKHNTITFKGKQDACRGVHSACRREVNRHKLDICVLRLRQGRIPGIFVCRSKFHGLKVGRGS